MYLLLYQVLLFISIVSGKRDIEAEKKPSFWKANAKKELEAALDAQRLNTNVAKNVIIFLGDGMGISTVTAGRILKGQLRGESGEETKLTMETLPHAALSKTYSANAQVSDSAATATAYLCGVKSNWYTLGVNAATVYDNCESIKGNGVESVLVDSYKAGKSAGVVTTTRIQHATPGATYAHAPNREWYGDADLTEEAKQNGCKDIALQFYEASDMITVALGGGRKYMQPENTTDYEYPKMSNSRKDGKDLIQMWKNKMASAGFESKFVWNKKQFDDVDVESTDRLLGLFEPSDMHYDAERSKDGEGEPSIAEMTSKAIQMLQKNDKGYFLLVEGGRIDHGHHSGNAYLSLHDVVAFDNAIAEALRMTSQEDTMIIVTADHSHVFTIGGKSIRGNNIFGLQPDVSNPVNALDNKPYTTLIYANGPGFHGEYFVNAMGYNEPIIKNGSSREDLTNVNTTAPDYLQQSAIPLDSETHGGEDVAIFASGPMAHLFHGVHEQSYIAYVMRYASCVGPDQGHCMKEDDIGHIEYLGSSISVSTANSTLRIQFIFLIILSVVIFILLLLLIRNSLNSKRKANYKESGKAPDVPLSTRP
uniref:alkaline phosphatase-like n=1 Tax=Styela clava TaxID=7725 RepID=UPI00193AA2C8|nr:alkaline phosphatase-like [Styela clava]